MNAPALERLIAQQQALIDALDKRDVTAINHATSALASAVEECRSHDSWHLDDDDKTQLDHALRMSNAARIRINYLTDWTRQRIDQLGELRGMPKAHAYSKQRN